MGEPDRTPNGQSVHMPEIDHSPLSDDERHLLRVTETMVWTPELRIALGDAVRNRGFAVGPHDTPDQLADLLRKVGGA